MFDNTLTLVEEDDDTEDFSIVDLSVAGRSVRKAPSGAQFSISGINTKENPGYVSRRVTLRIEQPAFPLTDVTHKKGKCFAQFTIGYPVDEGTVARVALAKAVAELVNFLTSTSSPDGVSFSAGSDAGALIDKLIVGEV